MDTTTLQLLRRLLDVAQQSGPAVARRADLSHTELNALELLTRQAWGPGELARHLGVTSAAASGIVDRLVARGHVQRRPHEGDGRRTQVVLTTSGRIEVLGHLMPMFAALDELDRGLGDEERAVVDRYLTGAIEAIRQVL
jgi:DNA-binding MarR family transcriptional regulator